MVTRKEQKPRREFTGIIFLNDFKAELSIVIREIVFALKNNRSLTCWVVENDDKCLFTLFNYVTFAVHLIEESQNGEYTCQWPIRII